MDKRLKPCPFCGGKAELRCFMGISWVKCIKCETTISAQPSLEKAIEVWNKRREEPVRHGRWIPHETIVRSPFAKNYDCSECGHESFAYPNCPYCRAVMDKKEKKK